MPDSRRHRGAHPEDATDFAASVLPALRAAAAQLSFLLEHDYAIDASVKLVGDHHQLTARQRKAVLRAACAPSRVAQRAARRCYLPQLTGRTLMVDGFNSLITVEAWLSRAPLFRGRDGALRDLASVHGTYRGVHETEHAAALLVACIARSKASPVTFVFDRPVGNSGRTRLLFEATCSAAGLVADVQLCDRVDRTLVESGAVVASSDSWVLDHAAAWVDLPSALLGEQADQAWLLDLSSP